MVSFLNIANKLGAFPFAASVDEETNEIRFISDYFSFCIKLFIWLSTGIIPFSFNFLMPLSLLGKVDLDYMKLHTGFSTLDVATFTSLCIVSSMSTIAFIITLHKVKVDVLRILSKLNQLQCSKGFGLKSKAKVISLVKQYIFATVLISLIMWFSGYGVYDAWIPDDKKDPIWEYAYSISYAVVSTGAFFTPLTFTFGCLMYYIVSLLTECFGILAADFKQCCSRKGTKCHQEFIQKQQNELFTMVWNPEESLSNAKQKPTKEALFEKSITCGLEYCKLAHNINQVLSPLIFIHVAYGCLSTTTTFYGKVNIFFYSLSFHRVMFSVAFALMCCIMFKVLFGFYSQSQDLENERQAAAMDMKEYYVQHFKILDQNPGLIKRYELLLEKLTKPNVISPYNFFGVNHSSFMEAMAVAATYLIVLMQFKAAEA